MYLFEPILKSLLWGGDRIVPFKQLKTSQEMVGESWELSSVEGSVSVVANGAEKGLSLTELLDKHREHLVGAENYQRYGNTFPLLIKFIDARLDLSIQVHPNDELAWRNHHSFGKTEMWYVMEADKGASLYSGFQKQIDADGYCKMMEEGTITDALKKYALRKGDVFFLPAGRVHSIGAGTFIAEIQQTSNITYRIFDFNRKDKEGHTRELHTELAKEAIDYTVLPDYQTHYQPTLNEPVELARCPYFTTSLYDLTEAMTCDYSDLDSFVIYICLEGKCRLTDDLHHQLTLHAGQTVLIPADTEKIGIEPEEKVKLLEVFS